MNQPFGSHNTIFTSVALRICGTPFLSMCSPCLSINLYTLNEAWKIIFRAATVGAMDGYG